MPFHEATESGKVDFAYFGPISYFIARSAGAKARRVLVAVITGPAGERIQAWRKSHDPAQAARIPPHTTLRYWVPPVIDAKRLGAQVAHAFPAPIPVQLGAVRQFEGGDGSLYIELLDTGGLDKARARLFDAAHVALGAASAWPWHVTCARSPEERRVPELMARARALPDTVRALAIVQLLELHGQR